MQEGKSTMQKIRLIVNNYQQFSKHVTHPNYDFDCINSNLSKQQEFATSYKRTNWNDGNKIQWHRLISSGNVELVSHEQMFSIEEDLSTNKNKTPTFYLVTIPEINCTFETGWIQWLPDNVRHFLKGTGIPILISQPGEFGFEWLEQYNSEIRISAEYSAFSRKLAREGFNNPVVLHNMSKIYMDLNTDQRKLESVYSRQWFKHASSLDNISRGVLTYEQHLKNVSNKKIFFCSNRAPREARCLLLLSMLKYDTLKEGHFSFLCESPATVKLSNDEVDEYFSSLAFHNGAKDYNDYIDRAKALLPIVLEENTELQQEHVLSNSSINIHRLNSLFEIVTETHDITKESIQAGVLSEKICWPILNQMPFIILGHRKNTQLLQDLGFKTFDYDFMISSNPTESIFDRTEYINKVIKLFTTMTPLDRFNWLNNDSIRDKIKHNYDLLVNTDWNQHEVNALADSFRRVKYNTVSQKI